MSFVILSTGSLAGSTPRTLKTGTVMSAIGVATLAILGCGLTVGYLIGHGAQTAGNGESATDLNALQLRPDGPESRALIERVGELSGRLIRLETQAASLAREVDAAQGGGPDFDATVAGQTTADAGRPADSIEPSGGPFVEAVGLPIPGLPKPRTSNLTSRLALIAKALDRVEATFAHVARATTVRNLDSMAFPSRLPLAGHTIVTSGFGIRLDPFTRRPARHTGLDFRAPFGAAILASAGGRVRFAGYRGAYGKTVEIDHGGGLVTRYGHASRLYVHVGQIVLPGQRIAAVGSTGRSTGAHLHFEVLRNGVPVSPRRYLAHKIS